MIARLYLLVWVQFCLSLLCLFHSCSDGNIRQTELLAVHSELFGCSKEFSCLKCLEAYVLHESANNMLDLRSGNLVGGDQGTLQMVLQSGFSLLIVWFEAILR